MPFIKYLEVERLEKEDCEGLLDGVCDIFPKIDGTNSSIWYDQESAIICCGSRNRNLTDPLTKDNHNFRDYWVLTNHDKLQEFFLAFPNLHLFGEYLVKHTLKTYRASAWNQFYIFDVWDDLNRRWLAYDEYAPICQNFYIITHFDTIPNHAQVQVIPMLAINPSRNLSRINPSGNHNLVRAPSNKSSPIHQPAIIYNIIIVHFHLELISSFLLLGQMFLLMSDPLALAHRAF